MLFVTLQKKQVTIDGELKVSGPEPAKSVIKNEVAQIDPEKNHATNWLAYLFYELEKRGYNVEAEAGDLDEINLPPGATA